MKLIIHKKKQRGSFIFQKIAKAKCLNISYFKNTQSFDIISKETGRISQKCLLVLSKVIQAKLKKEVGSYFQSFVQANHPLTSKGLGIRIGKGKGNIKLYVCKIFPGTVLYKIYGVNYKSILLLYKSLKRYSKTKFAFYSHNFCILKSNQFLLRTLPFIFLL